MERASSDITVPSTRLASIDAYRGLAMLLMMGEVLRFGRVSAALPGNAFWAFLARHQSHVDWAGCHLHDMIFPSFTFLVGVALPFSLARRKTSGQPEWRMTLHAFWRALVLVLLGVFLVSLGQSQTNWSFENTLAQIGLGYGFLYLIGRRSKAVHWIALAVILVGYWLAFALYPLPDANFNWARANARQYFTGFAAHWNRNTNFAWAFDTWFLNLFPRRTPFTGAGGGFATLSFITTLGTMIMGLMAGNVLRGERKPWGKVGQLILAGLLALGIGWLLAATGVCPLVKKIRTPSWVLFSGGWSLLALAGFYLVIDVWNLRRWAFPLVVVGMNSIVAYMIPDFLGPFLESALPRHLGHAWFTFAGKAYEPLLLGCGVLLTEWLVLYWMYRKKIFIKI